MAIPEKLIPLTIYKAYQNQSILSMEMGKMLEIGFLLMIISMHYFWLLKRVIGQSYCIGGKSEKSNKNVVLEICKIMDKIIPLNAPHKN